MAQLDTIAAIATAPGAGAVGVVRLSGPQALEIADLLYRTSRRNVPATPLSRRASHRVHHGWLVDADGGWLDEALVLVMRAPRSFTGEDVVELQTHGGATAPTAVLEACLAAGARLAAAGEFTKRAYLNGRLDLAQAEAVNDLVTAHGERGLAQALAQLDGALSRQVGALREGVVALMARIEAAIDYPDEIADLAAGEAAERLDELVTRVDGFLATARQGQLFREGARLAIIGRPNVGKSSLLNALLGSARAIVTPIAGTTRDILEEGLLLVGMPFRVVDTAGIRETEDPIEALGVARSREALAGADVVMLVVDAHAGVGPDEHALRDAVGDRPLVVVGNKRDLGCDEAALALLAASAPWVAVSAVTGDGLAALTTTLVEVALGMPVAAIAPAAINARHRASLAAARASLVAARASAGAGMPGDFLAIDLAAAATSLAEVTGDALAEEVIDTLFATFCVGK